MPTETRPEGWPERLLAYLDEASSEFFAWDGRRDCATGFAGRAVEAVTGVHPCPDLVGIYEDEAGAREAIARDGGLEAAVTKRLGPPLPDPLSAMRGDVVLFSWRNRDGSEEERLGVCVGDSVAAKGDPSGVAQVRMSRARVAWPVGRQTGGGTKSASPSDSTPVSTTTSGPSPT